MRQKIGFLAILLMGLLLFSSCSGLRIKTQIEKLGINFEDKDSVLRLEKDPVLFRLWVHWKPIQFMMTMEEKKLTKKILKIQNEAEQNAKAEAFVKWFWERRDDNTYDAQNEFKESFYNRVVEAQTRFANREDAETFRRCKYGKGWQTDMGLFYILLGERDNWERYTVAELVQFIGGDYRESALMPQEVEIWYYYDIPEEYDGFEFQNGVAYIIFERTHVWEFVSQWIYYLTQGYIYYYDPLRFFGGLNYGNYQAEVYTNFLRAVAESYIYDKDLEFEGVE